MVSRGKTGRGERREAGGRREGEERGGGGGKKGGGGRGRREGGGGGGERDRGVDGGGGGVVPHPPHLTRRLGWRGFKQGARGLDDAGPRAGIGSGKDTARRAEWRR